MTTLEDSWIEGSVGQALFTIGAVAGPLAAMGLMTLSCDNFRLVFWPAAIPGFLSVAVLVTGVKEVPNNWPADSEPRLAIRPRDLLASQTRLLAVSVAAILVLARCSPAFLLLNASSVGIGPAFVPIILVLIVECSDGRHSRAAFGCRCRHASPSVAEHGVCDL